MTDWRGRIAAVFTPARIRDARGQLRIDPLPELDSGVADLEVGRRRQAARVKRADAAVARAFRLAEEAARR